MSIASEVDLMALYKSIIIITIIIIIFTYNPEGVQKLNEK